MALPSAHRPSDLTSVSVTAGPSSSSLLTLKINKGQIFMNDMVEWYKKLNRRQRSELTKKRVIRYATTVAYRLNVPYDNLPENWLRTLYEEHEVTFKFRKKRKEREEAKKTQDDLLSMNIFERNVIDLTKEPPPPEWVTGYLSGTVKPRVLKVYKNPVGVMVVYYDYDATTVGPDGTCLDDLQHIPYDRDGIFPALESV